MTAASEREIDELASAVEGLEDTLDVEDVEDLRELSESMYEGLAIIRETHAMLGETRNRGRSFRFATCLLERHWSRERNDKT